MAKPRGRIDSLYRFLHSLNPEMQKYAVSYGVLLENETNTVGIFAKGGNPSMDTRSLSTGRQLSRKALVTFNINGDPNGDAGTVDAFVLCENYVDIIETTFNKMYTSPTGEQLYIQRMDILGDVNDLGLNKFQFPVFSFNIAVHYTEII